MSCRRWECCVLTASWTAWVPVSSGGRGPGRFPFAPWGQSIEYFNNGMYVNNCNSLLLLLFSFFNSSFGLILFFLAFSCLFFCSLFFLIFYFLVFSCFVLHFIYPDLSMRLLLLLMCAVYHTSFFFIVFVLLSHVHVDMHTPSTQIFILLYWVAWMLFRELNSRIPSLNDPPLTHDPLILTHS